MSGDSFTNLLRVARPGLHTAGQVPSCLD